MAINWEPLQELLHRRFDQPVLSSLHGVVYSTAGEAPSLEELCVELAEEIGETEDERFGLEDPRYLLQGEPSEGGSNLPMLSPLLSTFWEGWMLDSSLDSSLLQFSDDRVYIVSFADGCPTLGLRDSDRRSIIEWALAPASSRELFQEWYRQLPEGWLLGEYPGLPTSLCNARPDLLPDQLVKEDVWQQVMRTWDNGFESDDLHLPGAEDATTLEERRALFERCFREVYVSSADT